MVTFTTRSSDEPPASSTALRFSRTWRVSPAMPPPASVPGATLPSWPEAKIQSPALMACESGTRAGGTLGVCTTSLRIVTSGLLAREDTIRDRMGFPDNAGSKDGIMGLLDGKVAVITGASKGIGRVMSRLFAKEGAAVVCAARSGALVEETVALVGKDGGKAIAFVGDA